jgi:hypothetical protein
MNNIKKGLAVYAALTLFGSPENIYNEPREHDAVNIFKDSNIKSEMPKLSKKQLKKIKREGLGNKNTRRKR